MLREYVQKSYPPHVISGDLNNGNSETRTKVVPSVMSTSKSDARSGTVQLQALTSKFMDLGGESISNVS
jgi:hypothetical protein